MKKKLHCVLLVDDDDDCNYFHKRLMNKMGVVETIQVAQDGQKALDFLTSTINGKHPQPAIVFLDINMPIMNGWEFLEHYDKLDEDQKAQILLVMLTTSLNPDDKTNALTNPHVRDFETKYLSKESLTKLLFEHFPDYF
jgi:CheY-like chemotaxis protein